MVRVRPEQMPFVWLLGGYGVGFLGLIFLHNTFVGLAGFIGAIVGLSIQPMAARIAAQPFDFWKSPIRSFFYKRTEVKQFQIKDKVTDKGATTAKYAKNRTILQLASPDYHPKYGAQSVLVVEHDGELEPENVVFEPGEIVFFGTSGVSHNKVAISDLWETPQVYTIGATIHPVYILPRGPGLTAYREWISKEFAEMESPSRRQLKGIVKGLGL